MRQREKPYKIVITETEGRQFETPAIIETKLRQLPSAHLFSSIET